MPRVVDCAHQRCGARIGNELQRIHERPEKSIDRHRPKGAGRSGRSRPSGIRKDRGASQSLSGLKAGHQKGRRSAPPFFCPYLSSSLPSAMDKLEHIVASALAEFAACNDPAALENCKAKFLGKSGQLTESLKGLSKLSAAERPAAGARLNQAKSELAAALNRRRDQ